VRQRNPCRQGRGLSGRFERYGASCGSPGFLLAKMAQVRSHSFKNEHAGGCAGEVARIFLILRTASGR
jgi:hypothetical protein